MKLIRKFRCQKQYTTIIQELKLFLVNYATFLNFAVNIILYLCYYVFCILFMDSDNKTVSTKLKIIITFLLSLFMNGDKFILLIYNKKG